MRIEILKNKETSLVIDDIGTTIDEDGMLKEGYLKAIQSLVRYNDQINIIRRQLEKTKESNSQINDILYQSPHNIIAFSGKRGTGKTSAMISFSEFLKKGTSNENASKSLYLKHFGNVRNLVLSPIDPTMLEHDQNILNVVLSRLIYKAEERWDDNTNFHRTVQYLEKEKNELLRKANDCMNGIKAIKSKAEINNLTDIQRIGDSAVLKKNLYDLVNMVNSFCLGKNDSSDGVDYLIIPIDDTDCQIVKAHDVMEDLRRYLTIPNVVILMATDDDLLRHVFAQHYADAFKTSIDRDYLESDYMEHYAEKYLTKLMPVTNRVYLPVFEKILKENSVSLELGYYADTDRDVDIISKSTRAQREQNRKNKSKTDIDFNFQAKILKFIYKKTGLVFLEHSMYINNIIPTTMRGLAHLLNFLDSMDDVKEFDYTGTYTPEKFVKTQIERLEQLEKNLVLFEEFFMKEWVPAKVPVKMIEIINGIEEQVPENLIQYAFDESVKFYYKENDIQGRDASRNLPKNVTYYDLMDLLGDLTGTFNIWFDTHSAKREDYYNSFAIRTLISIKNNKLAVTIRRRMLETINLDQFSGIKYTKDQLSHLLLPVLEPKREGNDNTSGPNRAIVKPFVDQFLDFLQTDTYENQLSAGNYCMHELAWIVSCNWDVQDILYKSIKNILNEKPKPRDITEVWNGILDSVEERNCSMLQSVIEGGKNTIKNWNSELIQTIQMEKLEIAKYEQNSQD